MAALIHREHVLQRAIKRFVLRCVIGEFEFVAHDRAAQRSDHDHIWQAARGLRRGWPDTEILLADGRTFRCELKAPGRRLDDEEYQAELITRLNLLGHPTTWANSAAMYGAEGERFGVPLRPNWRTVAQLLDEQVLAEIRTEQTKTKKVVGEPTIVKLRTVRRGRATVAQIRKAEAARHLP